MNMTGNIPDRKYLRDTFKVYGDVDFILMPYFISFT